MSLQLEDCRGSRSSFLEREKRLKGTEEKREIVHSRASRRFLLLDMTMYKGRRRNQRCEYDERRQSLSTDELKLML